jgi:hypothetical protein
VASRSLALDRLRPFVWPLVIVLVATTFYLTARRRRDLVDFEVYRTAGIRALAAEPLYRPEDGHYQFKYLPAFALAMTPLAKPDPETTKSVWFALSVALLIAFVGLSVRALPERRLALRRLVWLTALVMAKFYVKELVFGQTNVLLGLIAIAALLAARRDRRALAGVLIGLAVFVKPYALILLPWLALVAGVPALLAAGGVIAAGLALPAVVYGWHGNLELLVAWFHTVTDTTAPNLLDPENISFAAMWAKWLGPGATASALAAATGVASLGLAGLAGVWRRRVRAPDYLEFGLLMILVPLLSPQGWDYVLLLATPAVICLLDRWPEMSGSWRTAIAAAIGLMSFTIFDLIGRTAYGRLMALSVITVSALVLAAGLVHLRWRALA